MANVHTFDGSHEVNLLLPPADQGDLSTSWFAPFADGGGADRVVFLLITGAITNDIDMKIEQAQNSGGTGVKDVTSALITTITSTTDQSIVSIELAPSALDDVNGFKYVRATVTVAGANTELYSVHSIKHRLRRPGDFTQPTSYRQQVKVF